MLKHKLYSVIALLLFSPQAFAYLDPGSGSALISVIITAIGSFWHSIKSVFYKITGSKRAGDNSPLDNQSVVLFSEGKNYWGTFKPIITELTNRKIHFRYFTLDLYDPALEIENTYMKAKRLSPNSLGYSKLSNVSSNLMIATSPNIGTHGYPISKPKQVKNLMHVFHHIGDIASYKKYSLDSYDSVMLAGEFQIESIKQIENKRGLKAKELVPVGLPYLDYLLDEQDNKQSTQKADKATILIGSSWGNKGCLNIYGLDFIKQLSSAGYNIIIRPHPHSLKAEPKRIKQWQAETQYENIEWDFDVSPTRSMAKSDLLISDTSAIRFDYAFLYKKPVITLNIELNQTNEFEASELTEQWHQGAAYQIGVVLNQHETDTIVDTVRELMEQNYGHKIDDFVNSTLLNVGSSSSRIADYIEKTA